MTALDRPVPWLRVIAAGALGAVAVGVVAGVALGTAMLRVARAVG